MKSASRRIALTTTRGGIEELNGVSSKPLARRTLRVVISVASGTPQMHACWVLLTTSGEFPARILHIRPPRFVTADRDLVTEIDLTRAEFPVVRVRDVPVREQPFRIITDKLKSYAAAKSNDPAWCHPQYPTIGSRFRISPLG
jgi:sigma54-dependent transcription regulator